MKKKILSFIVFTFLSLDLIAKEPKLEEIIKGLNGPWSLSFVDSSRILVTEKSGNIFLININADTHFSYSIFTVISFTELR